MARLPVQDLQEAEGESEVSLGSIWLTFSDSSCAATGLKPPGQYMDPQKRGLFRTARAERGEALRFGHLKPCSFPQRNVKVTHCRALTQALLSAIAKQGSS